MQNKVDTINHVGIQDTTGILEAIHTVMHAIRIQTWRDLQTLTPELSPLEARVLAFFAKHPGATQSDLAHHTGRDKGQLARIVGPMKDKGWLICMPDRTDKRSMRLFVSEDAIDLQEKVLHQMVQIEEKATAGISQADKLNLIKWLEQVNQNLHSEDL